MNVLVAGGAGYTGSKLVPTLINEGYKVDIWDINRHDSIFCSNYFDAKHISVADIIYKERYYAVVNLVATFSRNAEESYEINFKLGYDMYKICSQHNVRHFIFTSTCGVLNPENTTEYTKNKREAENALLVNSKESDCQLSILRLAPVYGLTPNMKYDSIVNSFVRDAAYNGKIEVWGKDEYRPVAHIDVVVKAINEAVKGIDPTNKIYNVATGNHTKGEIALEVKNLLPHTRLILRDNDKQGYRIDTLTPGKSLSEGIKEMLDAEILRAR